MNLNFELAKLLGIRYDLIVPVEVSAGIFIFSVIFYISWSLKIGNTQNLLDQLRSHLAKTDSNGLDALNTVISKTQDPKIKSLLYETRDNFIEVEGDLGTEYYSLKSYSDIPNCNDFRINYFNIVFNFSLLFIFFIILCIVLIVKYKGKLTPEEQEEKNMETKTYILSKIKNFQVDKLRKQQNLITGLPHF